MLNCFSFVIVLLRTKALGVGVVIFYFFSFSFKVSKLSVDSFIEKCISRGTVLSKACSSKSLIFA